MTKTIQNLRWKCLALIGVAALVIFGLFALNRCYDGALSEDYATRLARELGKDTLLKY